jgi:hypothetical protein
MKQLVAHTGNGTRISAALHESPVAERGLPLLVALHGGTRSEA